MIDHTLEHVRAEVECAEKKYGAPSSSHESLGVLLEEVAELTDAIRSNYIEDVRREAIQVAAVAARLAMHCQADIDLGISGQTDFACRSGF